jgi:hypothetical protein
MTSTFHDVLQVRPRVLIFLPNTNELQRFVLANAFADLATDHELHYVIPRADAEKMRAAAPDVLTAANTIELEVPPERYAQWAKLFQAACVRFADLSPSFAIRANMAPISRIQDLIPASLAQTLDKSALFQRISQSAKVRRLVQLSLRLPSRVAGRTRRSLEGLRRTLTPRRSTITGAKPTKTRAEDEFANYAKGHVYKKLVNQTLATMEPLKDIVEIFDRVSPLYVIIPTSLLDLFCNDVLWACQSEHVACLLLQSGWDNLSSKGIIHHMPTALGCWGNQSILHGHRIQRVLYNSLHALGAPHYEFLKPATAAEVAEARRELAVADGERLVLFGGSFRQFDETAALLRLDAAIESGRFGPLKVLYRPHPWRADRQHEDDFFDHKWSHVVFDPDMKDRYMRARREPGYLKRAVPMYDMAYLARLLSAADAVISPMSTLLLEALIMNRPTMAIAFGDGKHAHNPSLTAQMTHFAEIKRSGALVWCDDERRFEAGVAELLKGGFLEKTAKPRRRVLGNVVTREPGSYGERLATFCREVVDPRARRLRAERTARRRGTISHAYGANLIARDYCGLHTIDPEISGYWMHGWIPAYHSVDPALIALHKKPGQHDGYDYEAQIAEEKAHTLQWVSRRDQADYLIAHGYRHVRAIGLPIVYISDEKVQRIPNSLLVMPPHSHNTHGPDDPLAEEYAALIAGYRSRFEHIWVCLHEDDLMKRQWVESFQRRGIGVFPSADQSDPRTLHRLKRILSTFECVTTNGYGSHIAYAAYCGARVSIFGPFAEFPRHRMVRTHAIKMFPKLVDIGYYLCTEKALREHYPFLFVEPHEAPENLDWGRREVGESNRLSPQELAAALGWNSDKTGSAGQAAAERQIALAK